MTIFPFNTPILKVSVWRSLPIRDTRGAQMFLQMNKFPSDIGLNRFNGNPNISQLKV
jgi:hypothetical protein